MPSLKVDFSEAESMEPLPKGDYECLIDEASVTTDVEEGKFPYIKLVLKVNEGGEYDGRLLWVYWSFSPKAMFRMIQDLTNMGFDVDPAGELDIDYDEESGMLLEPALVGLPVQASVSQRPYENRMTNQVDAIRSTEDVSKKPASGGKKREPAGAGKAAPKRKFK